MYIRSTPPLNTLQTTVEGNIATNRGSREDITVDGLWTWQNQKHVDETVTQKECPSVQYTMLTNYDAFKAHPKMINNTTIYPNWNGISMPHILYPQHLQKIIIIESPPKWTKLLFFWAVYEEEEQHFIWLLIQSKTPQTSYWEWAMPRPFTLPLPHITLNLDPISCSYSCVLNTYSTYWP